VQAVAAGRWRLPLRVEWSAAESWAVSSWLLLCSRLPSQRSASLRSAPLPEGGTVSVSVNATSGSGPTVFRGGWAVLNH